MLARRFSVIYGVATAVLVVAEVVGIRREAPGDTITEHWRWVDRELPPAGRWAWRVFTAGLLSWAAKHFLGGHE